MRVRVYWTIIFCIVLASLILSIDANEHLNGTKKNKKKKKKRNKNKKIKNVKNSNKKKKKNSKKSKTNLPTRNPTSLPFAYNENFNIELHYIDNGNDHQIVHSINKSALKISQLILSKHAPFRFELDKFSGCNKIRNKIAGKMISDIVIAVELKKIDGLYGTLGGANICLSDEFEFPRISYMALDIDDLEFINSLGLLDTVIEHEILHAIGMGTASNFKKHLITNSEGEKYFIGKNALEANEELGFDSSIKMDGSHFSESIYKNEIMTPALNSEEGIISLLTLRSLQDIGYLVDLTKADLTYNTNNNLMHLQQYDFTHDVDYAEAEIND